MKYVVTYDLADGAYDLAMQHYPAHRARLDEFMADDPFLKHGVVGRHRVREWDEVLQPEVTT